MKIKRFIAKDMRSALQQVRNEFGGDAVILSNKAVAQGVELVAAMDFDEKNIAQQFQQKNSSTIIDVKSQQAVNSAKNVSWVDESSIQNMQAEINALRNLLEDQLAGLAWHEKKRTNSTQVMLLKRLHELDLANDICRVIVNDISLPHIEEAWQLALAKLSAMLPVYSQDILADGGIFAFVGPTGVGKTTTIAKLAARYSLQHGTGNIGLITMDNYRIAAHEQLATYGNILDVKVYQANDLDSLRNVLHSLRHKELVLIDSAGMSQRDKRIHPHINLLAQASVDIKILLVLSATSQMAVIDEVALNFKNPATCGCIMTKVDEASSLGNILSVLIKNQLDLTYISDGQSVPEDIHVAQKEDIIKRTLSLVRSTNQRSADEELAHAFGDLNHANESTT